MAKPAKSAAERKKALIDDQEYLSKEEKEAAKAKIDEKEKQDKAAEQAKAYKEADLIGAKDAGKLSGKTDIAKANKEADLPSAKDAEKLSKTSAKKDSSSGSSAKKTSSTGKTNLGTSKQAAGDLIAKAAGAEEGIRKIEAAKTEKAAAQARANKEADLPGFDGRAAQKAYQQKVEQEKAEYLNTKEARDKKYALEQELAELKAQAKNQTKEAGTVQIVASGRKGGSGSFVDPETQKRIDELEKEISDLNKNITLASRAQEKKYLYNRASGAEDFSEYSKEPQKEEQAVVRPHQQNIGRETETLKGYMTDEERAVYNYYFNKFGEAKAEEFFESIEEDLNFRQAQAIFAGNEGKVFNEYIQGAAAGLEDAKEGYKGAINMLLGIDEEQPTSTYDFLSGMAREDLGKSGIKLPEVLGGASLGQIGFDVVNTTANMLPSIMLGTLGGSAVGAVGIGASAAGNAYNEAIKAGYDKEQATNYAALVGASEASLGYLLGGIEATGGKLGKAAMAKVLPKIDSALAKAAVNVGGKMLSEFSEEYLQEVLSPVFENIALLEENEIDLLSPEAIYSGILGALSAGGIALADGSANVPEVLEKAEVPVPFEGKAQPGTEAALVADKITEIENRPISEAEKAAKMEEVMQAVAGTTGTAEIIAEAEKFKNIHKEKTIRAESSEEDRYKILKDTNINIKPYNEQKLQGIDIEKEISGPLKEARKKLKKLGEKFGVFKEYVLEKENIKFSFSKNNFDESQNKQKSDLEGYAKMLTSTDDIVENAVLIEVHKDKYKGTIREDKTLLQTDVFLSAFSDGEDIVPVKMEVKEFKDKNNSLYVLVTLEKIKTDKKIETKVAGQAGQNGTPKPYPVSNIKIADIIAKIKPSDGDLLKYLPDQMLDDKQIESKYLAVAKEKKRINQFSQNVPNEKPFVSTIGNNVFGAGIFGKGDREIVSAEISDSAKRVLEQMAPKTEKQSSTSQVNLETESTNLADIPQSEKSKRIERRYQRAVEEGVASVFGIDRSDIREDIRPILEEISAEVKDGKKISDEQIDRLYKTAFESGYITEEFPQYDETRKYIRSTPIFVDETTRHEFGDDFEFRDFARSNFGSIKISSDPRSRHLDDFYKSLFETEPGFFSEEETDPRTQLENIADFMQQTKKQYYGLSEVYSGTELSDFEAWAKKELRAYMDDFGKGLDTVVRYERDRQIKATNKAREIDRTASFEQAKAAFEGNRVFEAQKAMEKAKANALLNDSDLLTVKRLHEGTLNEADVLALGGNFEGILEVYRTEKAYCQARAPFDRYKAAYKTALQHDAVQFTELSDEWTDKKIGFEYSRETAERNVRDIAGKGGERVISEYFAPVHENEAMKIRWIKEMNQRVADLELGKMNRYERAYAQMIGENAAYIAEGKLTKHNQAEHDALNEKISVLLSEHGKKIDKAKCEKAAAGFMDIYKDIREEWNDERIRRGQEPIGEIENYFPHFLETKPETLIQKFFSLFGFDISSSKLPTDIAGRTADRKPNSRYNPHANRRTSDITDYDILKGFDGYVRAVGDNIFHTEDIQKLRALSDTIRTKYSSAETEKRIEEIRNREDLSEADKETLIADVFKAEPGAYHLSNFVVWLDEYTNILAGKKSRGDRGAEYQMGREIYDVSKALEGRIASNMIGYNLSTPVMNFVPMFQATADVSPVDIVSSFLQTGVAAVKGDSFISDNSDFLTNRFGVDSVYKKNYSLFSSENMKDFVSKVSDGGALLMEYVDRIVSESLVRARYEQNIKKGLDKVTAFSEADQWAAGLIADRSLGALPTVFNIKNPVAKAVTMFQVEANNQYSYIFKDAGKYKWKSEGAFNTIAGQLAFWAAMAICNGLADELLGRDNVVPDPIGMTVEAIEKIQKGEKIGDVALDTATNIVEQIPFVGGLLGGGRIPISTALPDFEQSLKLLNPEVSWDKKGQIILDELFKPLSYIFLPSGAGQLWKTGKGIGQLAQGGAYGMENDGSEYLKFPQEYDPESIIKTVLFGQYASDRAQEYIDSGFKGALSAKQTEQMELAEEYGLSKQEFYDVILGLRDYDKKEEKQEAILQNEDLDAREKSVIDWILFGKQDNFPESTRDYTSPEAFYRSGLETGELRLYEDGFSREDIETVEGALRKGGTKAEDIAAIQKAMNCTEAEAFEIYQKRNGNWIDGAHYFTNEQEERAKGAADFYNMSTDDYLAVLNYSKFGTVVADENGEESYSTKMEEVLPKIMEATGWNEETAKKNYLMVNKYEYGREDIEEAQTFDLDTSQSWYEVEDKGYFVARNVLKTVEGTKDEYGNTVSGSKKEAAVKEIAKQLGIDETEATIYYLAANGDLVLSEDDLSSSQIEDMKAAVAEGWTERQFLDAVNVVKLSGATKKDDIIKALKDAGATDEMARGYYNLRQNYDYDKVTSSGTKTYSYGMKNQKQVDKANYYLENYNGGGELSSNDLAKWFAAAEGCKKKQEYIDAYMSAGATYSQALKFYNLMRGYDDDFNAWYKENGG